MAAAHPAAAPPSLARGGQGRRAARAKAGGSRLRNLKRWAQTEMMNGYLLVFDLDGTLIDSGLDPTADPAALPRFLQLYEADAVRLTRPYPGVPETLAMLRRRGYRTAICTNKPQHAALTVLDGLGLAPLFDAVAGGDRFAVKKPDPGHVLGLIAALGGDSAAAAMIGDNENDAAAAHAAGLPLVLMRYGYARVDPTTLGAAALLDRFADLPAALDRLGLTA